MSQMAIFIHNTQTQKMSPIYLLGKTFPNVFQPPQAYRSISMNTIILSTKNATCNVFHVYIFDQNTFGSEVSETLYFCWLFTDG